MGIFKSGSFHKSGMSLIELMVVLGLLGGTSLFVMKLSQDNMKATKTVESKAQIIQVVSDIAYFLSDQDNCSSSFAGRNASNTPAGEITELLDGPGNVKYNLATKLGNIQISSFSLNDSDPMVEIVPNDKGDTYLFIGFDKGNNTYSRNLTHKIKLTVNANASGEVIDCFTSSGSSGLSMWSKNPNDVNEIHYSDGNVGIGIQDPAEALHVGGNIQASGALTSNSVSTTDINAATINTSGHANVGGNGSISGNLDVSGRVRVGTNLDMQNKPIQNVGSLTMEGNINLKGKDIININELRLNGAASAGCNSSRAGSMRYNSTAKKMQFCDGSSWKDINDGSGSGSGTGGGGEVTLGRKNCTWHAIKTHLRYICPVGKYVAGVCLTNSSTGCNPGHGGASTQSTWQTAGGVYCCEP